MYLVLRTEGLSDNKVTSPVRHSTAVISRHPTELKEVRFPSHCQVSLGAQDQIEARTGRSDRLLSLNTAKSSVMQHGLIMPLPRPCVKSHARLLLRRLLTAAALNKTDDRQLAFIYMTRGLAANGHSECDPWFRWA